jgi:hypothetical protein
MPLISRPAWAVLALAFLPGFAAAGPIGWSYTVEYRTATGLGVLNLGTTQVGFDRSDDPAGKVVFKDYTITAPLPAGTASVSYPLYEGQPNDRILLFSVGQGYSASPKATAPASDLNFVVTVNLTDLASGQSGAVEFTGRAGVAASGYFPPMVLFDTTVDGGPVELTLGGNRYRVTPIGGLPDEYEEPARVGMWIDVTATTPEPGTLVLVGIGLGAAGLARARRRTM